MRLLRKSGLIAATAATALLMVTGPAKADPPSGTTPVATDIVGVGSDTTEFVLDQISNDYNNTAPVNKLYSWDATPNTPGCASPAVQSSSCIATKGGASLITRPDGSSAGINALKLNTQSCTNCSPNNYDIDFGRASRPRNPGDPALGAGGVAFVAMAGDAVTIATQSTNNIADANLTTANLATIYTTCSLNGVTYKPYIPQAGSGTRAFFLSVIGVTTPGSCVGVVQENTGTQLPNDPMALEPYSTSKYIAQAYHSSNSNPVPPTPNLFGTDEHGTTILRSVDGVAPTTGSGTSTVINTSFYQTAYGRSVFNVVRDNGLSTHIPSYELPVFGTSGQGGWICKNGATDLKNYGLLPLSSLGCGKVS